MMTLEELMMVIDPNFDYDDILELEFRGNDEFNKVRSDCIEILEPLFEYRVDSIGISDDGNFRIWLDQPKQADTPQTEAGYCNECKWFRDKQVCGRCRSRNLFAKADIPQTEAEFTYCPRCGMRILTDTPQTERSE